MGARYVVSSVPVSDMSEEEILKEATELRYHLKVTEGDISTRKTWAQANQSQEDEDHLLWLARVRGFHSHLQKRYLEVRAVERDINRNRRGSTRGATQEQVQRLADEIRAMKGNP